MHAILLFLILLGNEALACRSKAPPEIKNTNSKLIPSNNRAFKIVPLLYSQINKVQKKVGVPVRVTSGYRDCPSNSNARGAANSDHLYGRAVDSNLQAGNSGKCHKYYGTVGSVLMKDVRRFNECGGGGPHVHVYTKGKGDCKNCDKEDKINYKRQDEDKEDKKEENKEAPPEVAKKAPEAAPETENVEKAPEVAKTESESPAVEEKPVVKPPKKKPPPRVSSRKSGRGNSRRRPQRERPRYEDREWIRILWSSQSNF